MTSGYITLAIVRPGASAAGSGAAGVALISSTAGFGNGSRPRPDLLHAILKTHRSDVRKLSLQGLLPFHGSPSKSSGFRHVRYLSAVPGRAWPRPWAADGFLIREVPEALMLSLPSYCLRLLVHARPLVSVAVSGDRHSVSYSPPGSRSERTGPDLQIRRFLYQHPDLFRSVRDLGRPSALCPCESGTPTRLFVVVAPSVAPNTKPQPH